MATNGLHIFPLAGCLRRDIGFPRRGVDAFGIEIAQGLNALAVNDVQSLREVARSNDASGAQRTFQQLEKAFSPFQVLGGAIELDPSFAGGRFHAQGRFQCFEVS
jgi:hypothetical protein